MRKLNLFRAALWTAVALFGGAVVALTVMRGGDATTAQTQTEAFGVPFRLTDKNGAPITEAVFQGKPSAVFFGFTHCPEVCPTTLSELGAHREALRKDSKDFQIVFVSIDPQRDTPDMLKTYVGGIAPDVVAITGDPAGIDAMAKGWGVFKEKVGEGDDYNMNHTATTFLLDAKGQFVGTIAYGEASNTAKAKLERLATATS